MEAIQSSDSPHFFYDLVCYVNMAEDKLKFKLHFIL